MFEKENRYITRAVLDVVPIEINLLLYDLINELTIEKDYLQIFELIPHEEILEIIHKQEIPEFTCKFIVRNIGIEKSMKIYVIDSGDYSTMMFSSEY